MVGGMLRRGKLCGYEGLKEELKKEWWLPRARQKDHGTNLIGRMLYGL